MTGLIRALHFAGRIVHRMGACALQLAVHSDMILQRCGFVDLATRSSGSATT
jgi:hypothetical protein